jgi:hypothetical protein
VVHFQVRNVPAGRGEWRWGQWRNANEVSSATVSRGEPAFPCLRACEKRGGGRAGGGGSARCGESRRALYPGDEPAGAPPANLKTPQSKANRRREPVFVPVPAERSDDSEANRERIKSFFLFPKGRWGEDIASAVTLSRSQKASANDVPKARARPRSVVSRQSSLTL